MSILSILGIIWKKIVGLAELAWRGIRLLNTKKYLNPTYWKYIKYVLIAIVIIAVCWYIHSLHKRVDELTEEAHRSNAKIMEIQSEKSSVDTADISGAGQISNNMAKDFQRSVQKQEAKQDAGKSKPLYQYTVNKSADNVIEEFKSQYDKGKAPKEVQKADFVTVTKDKTDSKVVEKADGTKEVVNTTTVKINAYNNYKPSVYVAPTVYPEVHRVDVVYTNRDILLGVNYDKNRDGNKFGVSVGYRIKSW